MKTEVQSILRTIIFNILTVIIVSTFPSHASSANVDHIAKIDALVENGGYAVDGGTGFSAALNSEKQYIPASILKIATAYAALQILGPEFRFETHFYLDDVDNLYIKGFGDPYLISEEIRNIIACFKGQGIKLIQDIIIDDSAFEIDDVEQLSGGSDNPYDALNTALAVNFNTVNIQKDKTGRILSAEDQTPILPLMFSLGKKLPSGNHRINITVKNSPQNISTRYAGELFRAIQHELKIEGEGSIKSGKVPENLEPVYVHHSRTLREMIAPLMLYSNNYIANQIFLACGSAEMGYPATWKKARKVMARLFQKELGLTVKDIKIVEGSGLSRENLITPAAMLAILREFKDNADLLPFEKGRRIKSGTLKGVYSYAGYFNNKENLQRFVLILNQKKNVRDKLIDHIEKYIRVQKLND